VGGGKKEGRKDGERGKEERKEGERGRTEDGGIALPRRWLVDHLEEEGGKEGGKERGREKVREKAGREARRLCIGLGCAYLSPELVGHPVRPRHLSQENAKGNVGLMTPAPAPPPSRPPSLSP